MLRQLAYDPTLFSESASLISKFTLSKGESNSEIGNNLQSLFQISMSGTHASPEQRADITTELLDSRNESSQDLGVILLGESIKTRNLISSHGTSFGAHPRDYGYIPRSSFEYVAWFGLFLEICKKHILAENRLSARVKDLFSNEIRNLWRIAESREVIEDIIRAIAKEQFWSGAWIAINGIIRYDSEHYTEDESGVLDSLRNFLKPKNLEGLVEMYVLSGHNSSFDLMDENDEILDSHEQINGKIRDIAALVCKDDSTFDLILPNLVSTYDYFAIRSFGRGLAEASPNLMDTWDKIVHSFKSIPEEKRQINLLIGFLLSCSTIDAVVYNCILDDVLNDTILIKWLHIFQTVAKIDQEGIDRINKSLDIGTVEIKNFESWAYIDINERVSDANLASYLEKIIDRTGSFKTVFEILRIRFDENNTIIPTEQLLKSSRTILTRYKFLEKNKYPIEFDEWVAKIAKLCLAKNFSEDAKIICMNICLAISSYQIRSEELKHTLNFLLKEYPNEFLNIFLEDDCSKSLNKSRLFSVLYQHRTAVVNISDEIIENWCDENPRDRYLNILKYVPTYHKPQGSKNLEWRPFIYKLLRKDEYFKGVLPELANSIRPDVLSESLKDNMQPKICLFEELLTHQNETVRSWAEDQLSAIDRGIELDFESRDRRFHQIDERFE